MLRDIFDVWRKRSDLSRLQYVYGAIVLVTLVLAGLVGLLNQTVAWQILSVTWIAMIALSINLVTFALINLVPKQRLSKPLSKIKKQPK